MISDTARALAQAVLDGDESALWPLFDCVTELRDTGRIGQRLEDEQLLRKLFLYLDGHGQRAVWKCGASVAQLAAMPRKDALKLPGIGARTLEKIYGALVALGLCQEVTRAAVRNCPACGRRVVSSLGKP